MLALAASPHASAVTVTLSAGIAGKTPERIGFNSGHFARNSNVASWWKYTGANAARIASTPNVVEGPDDNGPGRDDPVNWGDGVNSMQSFIDRRANLSAAQRANPANTTYVNWPYFENRFENNPTSGSNIINLNYAYGQLHNMGVDTLVTMTRTDNLYPFADPGAAPASISAAGWADRWEQWQHFYAQSFYLAKNFDIHRFQMYNEPNGDDTLALADYLDRLRIASDAIQTAVADVNAIYGKTLDPQMQGPVSAGGSSVYPTWGQPIMQSLHTNYLGQVDPNFQVIDTYAYQQYNLDGPSFGAQLASIKSSVTAAAGGAPMRYAITEFNTHTAGTFDGLTATLDTPSEYSTFGSILANLAKNKPDELYVFKFSQGPGDGPTGVKKNGVMFSDNNSAPYDVGGMTKGGEAVRLFIKGFAGAHDLLSGPTPSDSSLQMASAHDAAKKTYSLYSSNLSTSSKTLDLNFASWNVQPGSLVTVEEVSADRQGEVRQLIQLPASKLLQLSQPAQSVFLVTVPEKAPTYRATFGATDDAMVQAGVTNSTLNFGANATLYAKNDPTIADARSVSFIKFNLGQMPLTGMDQAVLKVFGQNEGTDPTVIAHVYGLTGAAADGWSESTITWNNAPNLGTGAGTMNDISQNFIEDIGGTAEIVGELTGSQTGRDLMIDVTGFVKEHADQQITFMIAREVRFDGENVDDALTSLKLSSKEQGVNVGPQLLLSLNPMALPGDFNADGSVNDADLVNWQAGLGTTSGAAASNGDADFDGDVDGQDFLAWQRAAGASLPASAFAINAAVPEPAGIALFLSQSVALASLARRRS